MGPFELKSYSGGNRLISSWYADSAFLVNRDGPWLQRGAKFDEGTSAGIFSFARWDGNAIDTLSFRVVLSP